MKFEWDKNKDLLNRKNHGVSFHEAEAIFEDPFHLSVLDRRFDYLEERWMTLGETKSGKLIVAGHIYLMDDDGTELVRIITARKATTKERQRYEKI